MSARYSDTLNSIVIDLRRPFNDIKYVAQNYNGADPIFNLFSFLRYLGARTAIVEDIEPTESIEIENTFLTKCFNKYKFVALQRITFWNVYFNNVERLSYLNDSNLLGYAILKGDRLVKEQNDQNVWQIYEAVIRPKNETFTFVPRLNIYELKCHSVNFRIEGIFYCENGQISGSAIYSILRSIISYQLNLIVTYDDIYSILNKSRIEHISAGLTLKEIIGLLESFDLSYYGYDFQINEQAKAIIPPYEIIFNSVASSNGALVLFESDKKKVNHSVFVYGYRINPISAEFFMQSTYHKEKKGTYLTNTMTHWINDFICNDPNLGPYCILPKHLPTIDSPLFVLLPFPAQLQVPCEDAIVYSHFLLEDLINLSGSFLFKENNTWTENILKIKNINDMILNPCLMSNVEYIKYLENVRDWHNNRENIELIDYIKKHIAQHNKLWVIEFSTQELIRSSYKLGEVVIRAEKSIEFKKQDESFNVTKNMILVRVPSNLILFEKDSINKFFSNLYSQTPYIYGGKYRSDVMNRNFQYQVALSFAGEDRMYAEQLAEILKSRNIDVFYDKYEQAELWGKNLYQHLQKIYRDKAKYCVIFISEAYARKLWTKHELEQAQARAFQENEEYILPIKIDDTKLPGGNPTTGYVDLRKQSIEMIADLLFQKLGL
jgi:TIR domain-containing protein